MRGATVASLRAMWMRALRWLEHVERTTIASFAVPSPRPHPSLGEVLTVCHICDSLRICTLLESEKPTDNGGSIICWMFFCSPCATFVLKQGRPDWNM
jgi:hypothetical protein